MYDENEALKYIRKNVELSISSAYDDDELLNVIDMIWDYYEANGMLDIDDDDDDPDTDELLDELVTYATRMLRRDKESKLDPVHLRDIISAELAYEDSII